MCKIIGLENYISRTVSMTMNSCAPRSCFRDCQILIARFKLLWLYVEMIDVYLRHLLACFAIIDPPVHECADLAICVALGAHARDKVLMLLLLFS